MSGVEQVWQNNAAKNAKKSVPRSSTEIQNKQSLIFVQKCNVTGGDSAYTAKILREKIKQNTVWQGVIVQILQYSGAHFSVVQK